MAPKTPSKFITPGLDRHNSKNKENQNITTTPSNKWSLPKLERGASRYNN